MIVKEYVIKDKYPLICKIENNNLTVTGSDGRFHLLQDWFYVNKKACVYADDFDGIPEWEWSDVIHALLLVKDKSINAKRCYHFVALWDICAISFGKKSEYIELTVKFPLGTHVKYAKWRTMQFPLDIFMDILKEIEIDSSDYE